MKILNLLLNLTSSLFGWLYNKYQHIKEVIKLQTFKRDRKKIQKTIEKQFFKYSIPIIRSAIITLFFFVIGDFLLSLNLSKIEIPKITINLFHDLTFDFQNLFLTPDFIGMTTSLIGASSAVLGLVFALYIAQFQLTTDKFSQTVVKYINEEEDVSETYFSLSIFSVVFNLFLLLASKTLNFPLFISSAIGTILGLVSIISLLPFKRDSLTRSKPISIFTRLSKEITKLFKDSQIKNQNQSYSLQVYRQKLANDKCRIFEDFLDDLLRLKMESDWKEGLYILGSLLRSYLSEKVLIPEKSAWYPSIQKTIEKYTPEQFAIKQAIESTGAGLYTTSQSYNKWFEDRIFSYYEKILSSQKYEIDTSTTVIKSLGIIINGLFDEDNNKNKLKGAWEFQDFENLTRVLDIYSKIIANTTIDKENTNISTYYLELLLEQLTLLRREIIDGFNVRTRLGIVIKMQENIKEIITNAYQESNFSTRSLANYHPSNYEFKIIADLFKKLEIEKDVEGTVITRKDYSIRYVLQKIEEHEELQQEIFLEKVNHLIGEISQISISQKMEDLYLPLINSTHMACIQIIDLEKIFLLKIMKDNYAMSKTLLILLSSQNLKIAMLQDCLENLFFQTIDHNLYDLFQEVLTNILFWWLTQKPQNQEEIAYIQYYRIPILWGAYCYLYSEFKQDNRYVDNFIEKFEKKITDKKNYKKALELLLQINVWGEAPTVAREENDRYFKYYQKLLDEIYQLPREKESKEWYVMPPVIHPSKVIKEISKKERLFSNEEDIVKIFLNYLIKHIESPNNSKKNNK